MLVVGLFNSLIVNGLIVSLFNSYHHVILSWPKGVILSWPKGVSRSLPKGGLMVFRIM
jgi:hypothetical protein